MKKTLDSAAILIAAICLGAGFALPGAARADILFSQGFETDAVGWEVFGGAFDATRVASGTNGITSASGSFHAETGTAAGNWGGYDFTLGQGSTGPGVSFSPGGYTTSVDIYLDVAGGWLDDTRFDFTSAINRSSSNPVNPGTHLRDFAFNAGFYDDSDGSPGSGTDRFIVSASNTTGRSNSFPKNPGRDPVAITTTGWYTFEHTFYDDGGVLAVDMTITDSSDTLVNLWTLSIPADLIGLVGGNRYGWFPNNEFGTLAIDQTQLTVAIPEPFHGAILGLVGIGAVVSRRRRQGTPRPPIG